MTDQETTGDSRRSFMAKGALATGALALGTGTFGTATVGAQENRVAVFANNYYPGADFDVVAQIQTSTTVEILQVDGETVSEISQPDEWTGHIIRYDIGQQSGITTFLFARDQSLSAGDSGTIGEDASVLSSELNLLNTSLNGGGSDDGAVEEDDTMEDNETVEEGDNETIEEEDNVTMEDNETDAENGGD